jgi:hypothetical protein
MSGKGEELQGDRATERQCGRATESADIFLSFSFSYSFSFFEAFVRFRLRRENENE